MRRRNAKTEEVVKNSGSTRTVVYDPAAGRNVVNDVRWDSSYDGDLAKVNLHTSANGRSRSMQMQFDNADLATMLNRPSVDVPIDRRLEMDFLVPPPPLPSVPASSRVRRKRHSSSSSSTHKKRSHSRKKRSSSSHKHKSRSHSRKKRSSSHRHKSRSSKRTPAKRRHRCRTKTRPLKQCVLE